MTVGLMEWMEMDARALHSTEWTKWTVDVEWIASLGVSAATHRLLVIRVSHHRVLAWYVLLCGT